MTIEKTDPAPSPAPAGASGGQRVRHKKRGTIYRVIGVGELQSDTELSEGARIVAYRCETDGRLWLRPQSEFEDGRFEPALAMTDAAWAKRAADLEEGHEVSAGIAPAPSPAPAGASDVSELVEKLNHWANYKQGRGLDQGLVRVLRRTATRLSQQAAEIERLRRINSDHCSAVNTLTIDGARLDNLVKKQAAEIERLGTAEANLAQAVEALDAIKQAPSHIVAAMMHGMSLRSDKLGTLTALDDYEQAKKVADAIDAAREFIKKMEGE